MLINLVGDYKSVVFFGKVGNDFKLVVSKYLAAGIRRIAEDQCFGFLFERRLQLVGIEVKCGRIERNVNRLRSREDRICAVVFIKR